MGYVLLFIISAYSWTLVEYFLHRFLGHETRWNNLFKQEHMEHHRRKDFFASPYKKALSAIVVCSSMFAVLYYTIGQKAALTITLGFLTGYMAYEFFHYYFHVAAPSTKLGIKLRKHHFYHHFTDLRMNHGVTTTLWDKVFGTYVEAKTVNVHQKFAMDWLKNNPEIYSKDYVIKSKTKYT